MAPFIEKSDAPPEVLNPELKIAISIWEGTILVRFNKPITSIRMNKKDAKEFARQLIKKAL